MYIYDFCIFVNTHSKYTIVKLTIIMLIIIFHINKWLTWHPLINVCGLLRPPILVLDYNP